MIFNLISANYVASLKVFFLQLSQILNLNDRFVALWYMFIMFNGSPEISLGPNFFDQPI